MLPSHSFYCTRDYFICTSHWVGLDWKTCRTTFTRKTAVFAYPHFQVKRRNKISKCPHCWKVLPHRWIGLTFVHKHGLYILSNAKDKTQVNKKLGSYQITLANLQIFWCKYIIDMVRCSLISFATSIKFLLILLLPWCVFISYILRKN